ncbi:hypothetical protein S40285_10016 [Stachybotrys chlorohalonatus IBT 40285]|uniref:Uncharacterized protein n=1 Tax=Stachybotrys chlorohalonatus (strain IBT 40285) TaxID=1283841 RepID=A0A084QVS5_STAC4|nr:hypothetical protein S40285_10016 [Stachybotrys chlorohalonata IBT 40285]
MTKDIPPRTAERGQHIYVSGSRGQAQPVPHTITHAPAGHIWRANPASPYSIPQLHRPEVERLPRQPVEPKEKNLPTDIPLSLDLTSVRLDRCPFDGETPAWTLVQVMFPGRREAHLLRPRWIAVLTVRVKDLPTLMLEGFWWDTTNIKLEKSCVYRGCAEDKQSCYEKQGFQLTRHYAIHDTAEDMQWIGKLEVLARELNPLSKFRVTDLTPDNIMTAEATNGNDLQVYYYRHWEPQNYINAIYDDVILKGWWPNHKSKDGTGCNDEEDPRAWWTRPNSRRTEIIASPSSNPTAEPLGVRATNRVPLPKSRPEDDHRASMPTSESEDDVRARFRPLGPPAAGSKRLRTSSPEDREPLGEP